MTSDLQADAPSTGTAASAHVFRVDIWHFILWSRYKARVFTALSQEARAAGADFRFFQFATTDLTRRGQGDSDLAEHNYPYQLLFPGSFEDVPLWRVMLKSAWLVWRSEADLIVLQCYNRPEYWLQLFVGRLRGKRMAVFCDATVHDHRQKPLKLFAKRLFLSLCSGTMGYGERSVAYARFLGMPPERTWVRCQSPALSERYSPEAALQARLANVGELARPRFLYVGRLVDIKRVDVLIRAFALVKATMPDATLRIVGDGANRIALQRLAASLGVEGGVNFDGTLFDDALWAEYSGADFLVLPSVSEPWGLVVNEALSFGCPVLVSENCGCIPEMVADGETGFAFRTDDVEDLAVKMRRAIDVFSDRQGTARACIARAGLYTPQRSARQIYEACAAMAAAS